MDVSTKKSTPLPLCYETERERERERERETDRQRKRERKETASKIQLMFVYFQWSCSSVYNQNYQHEDRRNDEHAQSANCRSGEDQCGQIG